MVRCALRCSPSHRRDHQTLCCPHQNTKSALRAARYISLTYYVSAHLCVMRGMWHAWHVCGIARHPRFRHTTLALSHSAGRSLPAHTLTRSTHSTVHSAPPVFILPQKTFECKGPYRRVCGRQVKVSRQDQHRPNSKLYGARTLHTSTHILKSREPEIYPRTKRLRTLHPGHLRTTPLR